MNLRKGIFRIYLVISGLWFVIFVGLANSPTAPFWTLIAVGVGVPAVIYAAGKWISDGFFGKKR